MARVRFGSLVKDYRLKKGWTQLQLAEALGYPSGQFISLMERDQSKVPMIVLGQLIVLLGIPESLVVSSLVDFYKSETLREIQQGKKRVGRG